MLEKNSSYCETARRFKVCRNSRIKSWERIYLTEGPKGLAVERRGKKSKGKLKQLPKEAENDLFNEI